MGAEKPANEKKNFLFTVEILVEGYNNGIALEALLNLLNTDKIKDYQIKKGIELGKIIETALAADAGKNANVEQTGDERMQEMKEQIERYKNLNTLVRMNIIKPNAAKLNIPCRILNHDQSSHRVTVYHVDEKKVYQFHISEIGDLIGY